MPIFRRLLKYSFKYKFRLLTGLILSLFVSIFNGVSLTSMIPIFDSMSANKNYKFHIAFTKRDDAAIKKFISGEPLTRIETIEYKFANLKKEVNDYFSNKSPGEVVKIFVILVFPIYLLKLIFLTLAIYFINSTGYLAIRDLRLDIYKKIQQMPLNTFVREKTGILMSRIINDVDVLAKIISSDLKDSINDFLYVITHLLLLFLLSWKMSLVVFIVIPVIMGPISAFTEKIRKATKNQQERLSALNGHLQEIIAGIRVIRAFSMEKYESYRFFKINDELSEKTFKGHFYHQIGPSLVELFGSILAAIFLSFGAYFITHESFSKGMFMAFFLTLIFIMRPIKQLSTMFNLIQSGVSAGERVFELVDSTTDINNPTVPIKLDRIRKNIEIRDVSYTYPGMDKPSLKNVNLVIQRGETIALVGSSGAGKSTLKDLIPRLIDPTTGSVLIDGEDIRNFRIQDLRRKIGIVSQEVFLFNSTIRENITCGKDYPEERILKALEDACAMDFVNSFENGLETMVGEHGVMLSGGQRQRISIARAFLLNPEVLILDEATSALDTESERQVQVALEGLYKNRTTIIIAHRLSTIQIANKIHYMEDGEIIESGAHEELMELDSKYKKLYSLQFTEV